MQHGQIQRNVQRNDEAFVKVHKQKSLPPQGEGFQTNDCGAKQKVPCGTNHTVLEKRLGKLNYFSSTLAPTSASFFWMSSASALEACSFSLAFGVSTSFLASIREAPVSSLTVLMTCILLAPTSARMTSNSVFSSSAGAAAPPAAGAAAATAETPNSSQMVSTSSYSSRTVIVLTDSTMAVIFSEAMVVTSINCNVLSGAVCIRALRLGAQAAVPKIRQQSRPACRRYPAGQRPGRQRYR